MMQEAGSEDKVKHVSSYLMRESVQTTFPAKTLPPIGQRGP